MYTLSSKTMCIGTQKADFMDENCAFKDFDLLSSEENGTPYETGNAEYKCSHPNKKLPQIMGMTRIC